MKATQAVFILVLAGGAIAPMTTSSRSLRVALTPQVSFEPAAVRVTAYLEPDANNRRLIVEADSGMHFTSSEMPLDGDRQSRATSVWLKNLPAGEYELQVRVEEGRGPALVERQTFEVASPVPH